MVDTFLYLFAYPLLLTDTLAEQQTDPQLGPRLVFRKPTEMIARPASLSLIDLQTPRIARPSAAPAATPNLIHRLSAWVTS